MRIHSIDGGGTSHHATLHQQNIGHLRDYDRPALRLTSAAVYLRSSMSKYSLNSGGNDPFSTLSEKSMSECSMLSVRSSVSFMRSLARKLLPLGRRWISYSRRHATYFSWANSTLAGLPRLGRSTTTTTTIRSTLRLGRSTKTIISTLRSFYNNN